MLERRDRAVADSRWRSLFPHCSVIYLDFWGSHHRAIQIVLEERERERERERGGRER